MTSSSSTSSNNCLNCTDDSTIEIRRNEIFGSGEEAMIIENIPMIKCHHCGIVYLEPKVSRMIDTICANPEQYSSLKEKFVAPYA